MSQIIPNTWGQTNARKHTNKLLESIEGGCLDKDLVILACLKYMSEDEVEDMAHINGFNEEDEA